MSDALLVRAPVGVVYRTLTDLDGWPRWQPGCRSVRLAGSDEGHDRHVLSLADRRRRWRIGVDVHGWRHDLGVRWDVRGDVVLASEWWLESRTEGTVLHHVVHGSPLGRRAEQRVRRHRAVLMGAMQVMKDHLELAVALADGRTP